MAKPKVPKYGMYTRRGDAVIYGAVLAMIAIDTASHPVYWKDVLIILNNIATDPDLAECKDTAVRDAVYDALYRED